MLVKYVLIICACASAYFNNKKKSMKIILKQSKNKVFVSKLCQVTMGSSDSHCLLIPVGGGGGGGETQNQ